MNVGEPVTPVRISEFVVQLMLDDLREVQLRRVPAADPVVRPEVTLALEVERRRTVPLLREKKKLFFPNYCYT